jgi:hypothetical protein
MGNLRESGFDFMKVWTSSRADQLRGSIGRGECFCPLANAAYSSMMCDPGSIARVGWQWMKQQVRRTTPRPPVEAAK